MAGRAPARDLPVEPRVENAYDVIVIGGGPAGLSGALVLGRCGRSVLVCDDDRPRNRFSHAMHGFLSRDGMPPADFLRLAREEVQRYPSVHFQRTEVVEVERAADGFEVTLAGGTVARGRKLLLATGLVDALPPVEGLRERWGRSVFPCPFCDAYEYRGQPMAVYGTAAAAGCGFALEMLTWTERLTLLTDGSAEEDHAQARNLERLHVRIDRRKIRRLEGAGTGLEAVCFEDGTRMPCHALFVITDQHQRNGFAQKLGARLTVDATVRTGPLQHTRVRGVYAAGNAAVGLQAAIIAAAEGFKAAYALNDELIEDRFGAPAADACLPSDADDRELHGRE